MDAQELLSDYMLALEAKSADLLASYYCFPCTFFIESSNRSFLTHYELESYLHPVLKRYDNIGLKKAKANIISIDEQSLSHLLVSAHFSLYGSNGEDLFQFNSKLIMQLKDFDLKISGIFVIDEYVQLDAAYKRSRNILNA